MQLYDGMFLATRIVCNMDMDRLAKQFKSDAGENHILTKWCHTLTIDQSGVFKLYNK